MSDVTPIRTLWRDDAKTMLKANPGDRVPAQGHEAHLIRAKSIDYDAGGDLWITITCSCGHTLGGAVR